MRAYFLQLQQRQTVHMVKMLCAILSYPFLGINVFRCPDISKLLDQYAKHMLYGAFPA